MKLSEQIEIIVNEAMKPVLQLAYIADNYERGSKEQLELYENKNKFREAMSKLWPIIAELKIKEQQE